MRSMDQDDAGGVWVPVSGSGTCTISPPISSPVAPTTIVINLTLVGVIVALIAGFSLGRITKGRT